MSRLQYYDKWRAEQKVHLFLLQTISENYVLEKGKLIHFRYAGVCTWLMLTLFRMLTSSSCISFKKHKWNVWCFVTRTAEWGLTLNFSWPCWCWQCHGETLTGWMSSVGDRPNCIVDLWLWKANNWNFENFGNFPPPDLNYL